MVSKLAVLSGLQCEGNHFVGTVKTGSLLVLVE
jgi:hypothetical protein